MDCLENLIDNLLQLQEWDKAPNVCYLAKEYYPEETSHLDLRMSGCYLRLGKTDESILSFHGQKQCFPPPYLLWLFSPNSLDKSGHKTGTLDGEYVSSHTNGSLVK